MRLFTIFKNHNIVCPDTSQMTTLSDLLPELLLDICDFLPAVDLKCFSISNHRMYELHRIYHRRLPTFTLTGDAKFSFLLRLEKDMPEYVACYKCNKLHRYDGSESFGLSGVVENRTSTLPCEIKGSHPVRSDRSTMTLLTHYNFGHPRNRLSHLQLKLAMKRYYYGAKYGISTKSLSYTQIHRYPCAVPNVYCNTAATPKKYMSALFSIEARICPEPLGLYIRMQDILVCETWTDLRTQSIINHLGIYFLCHHHKYFHRELDYEKLKQSKEQAMHCYCGHCTTVSNIAIVERNFDSRIALLITKWMNLGPGLDHKDPLWQIRADGASTRPHKLEIPQYVNNACRRFETQNGEPFYKLAARNLSYLKKERYKKGKPFVHYGPGFWYIPFKEPSRSQKPFRNWIHDCRHRASVP